MRYFGDDLAALWEAQVHHNPGQYTLLLAHDVAPTGSIQVAVGWLAGKSVALAALIGQHVTVFGEAGTSSITFQTSATTLYAESGSFFTLRNIRFISFSNMEATQRSYKLRVDKCSKRDHRSLLCRAEQPVYPGNAGVTMIANSDKIRSSCIELRE